MRDYLYLGSAPVDEDCVQVSSKCEYIEEMKAECKRYKQLLEKKFQIPEHIRNDVEYRLKHESHEFGSYYEVIIEFNEDLLDAVNYAFNVEANLPQKWNDEEAVAFVKLDCEESE